MEVVSPSSSSLIQEKKEKSTVSKGIQVDAETWFFVIHEYLRNLFENPDKDEDAKYAGIESLASVMGKNIIEACTDDRLVKYKSTRDILFFIGNEVWTYLFNKKISNIIAKEEGQELYLFIDEDFQFLRRLSPEDDRSKEYVSFCTSFIARLLKSMVRAFQIEPEILAETPDYIEYDFTIHIKESPPS